MIEPFATPSSESMDASLKACVHILLESLFLLLSGVLLFLLAGVRVLSALASLALAAISFTLWCITAWSAGIHWLQAHLIDVYHTLKSRV